ncbi:chromosome partitioning protein [Lachnospiraceae bacterium KH1T2]|nr:chromosome partitioning protein [Lachnospiraceae bacterium KH1T2]
MKKIVVANQKGGIGKTTTAITLASMLSAEGYKTLLIDTDQQGNSSDTYRAKIEGEPTLYDVMLDDDRIPIKDAIQHTEIGDIVPSDPLLNKADEIVHSDINGLYRLADSLDELEGYDYVIMDTNPSLNSILFNALVAADEVIIPIKADRYSLQGLSSIQRAIDDVKKRPNRGLKIAGFLLVMYNSRTVLSKSVIEPLQTVAKGMGTKLFETKIRVCQEIGNAQAERQVLTNYAPKCRAAEDYKNFLEELRKGGDL